MPETQIAAQLFTIRDHIKTRSDFEASMEKIRAMGYRAVQTSKVGPIADADVKRIVDDSGLTICNTHVSVDDLLNDIDGVIAQHRLWDCRHVAIGACQWNTALAKDGSGASLKSPTVSASSWQGPT